jgi:hypothetical protein
LSLSLSRGMKDLARGVDHIAFLRARHRAALSRKTGCPRVLKGDPVAGFFR